MPITAQDIARICNVSRGTVDRALHGRPGVKEETRERIRRVAEEHNYTPQIIASTLAKGKSMSIGAVVFDLKNRYFSQIGNTVSINARKAGYSTYIAVTEKDMEAEIRILQNLAARSVDGVIMLPTTQGSEYMRQLAALEMPIVTIGNHLPGVHHVSVHDFQAAYDGAHHIMQAGYESICFICPPLRKKGSLEGRYNITSQDLRAQGFAHYMDMNRELDRHVLIGKDYREAAAALVKQSGKKTAFFCSSDVYAMELVKHFRACGIRIPEDAGLLGFDNLDILDYIEPRITTISTSIEEQGELAVSTLLGLIAGENPPEVQFVPHVLCEGDTL